jgi:uncharacterized protein YndB with AHSA1/START domain
MEAVVEPKVVHATCIVERSFSRTASVVFAALSEPDKVRRWMSQGSDSELFEFQFEFREGGKQILKYKMGPATPIAGAVITNEARFQHIVPGDEDGRQNFLRIAGDLRSAAEGARS